MKRLTSFVAAILILAGCSGVSVRPATTTSTSTTAPTTPLPTTPVEETTTTVGPSGPPVGWIAPSGVPLAVTAVNGEIVEVLTPCGNPEIMTSGEPIYEVDVVIDPGHGGPIDTGAVAPTGLAEKDINLQVARQVHGILTDRGVASFITRIGDYPVPIRTRTAYSDLLGARAVVSLHHNAPAAPSSDIPGVEIFVQDQTTESARLGGLIYDQTMSALSGFEVDWDRAPDAGVMTVLNSEGEDAYGMVRLPDAPSALVELGYIANRSEAELYADPAYVPTVSTAVADAVESFLTSDMTGAALVEGRDFNPSSGVGRDQCIEPDLDAPLYPDIVDVTVNRAGEGLNFVVTMSSPYDGPARYADAWRVIGDDGVVYGVVELEHGHAEEQPFTRSLSGVVIPETVSSVTVQGRDQVYGWGGGVVEVPLP